ncbi:transcriptional regulator NrdR [Candidatus Woesearchaeota archaeon]|nr:transcriptional regulator NrdR [Candidatus Woesearchaeota archaeon]
MKCPFCDSKETKVVDKRDSDEITRRRRECLNCKKRFTTYEKTDSPHLVILKKDQRRESFDKNKLKTGLLKACEKRPVPVEKVEQVADKIEAELLQLKRKEIPSTLIGEKVMKELKKIDKVAYIRFASVYRDFKDVDDFKKEIKELK